MSQNLNWQSEWLLGAKEGTCGPWEGSRELGEAEPQQLSVVGEQTPQETHPLGRCVGQG